MLSRLQYISQGKTLSEQEHNIRVALDHGIKCVQVRWKNASEHQQLILSKAVTRLCGPYRAICIINDNVQIAKMVDADGVHLGLADTTISEARVALGPGKLIGGTANLLSDVWQRINEGCDYIGLGPFRFTRTKENLSPVLGLSGYQEIIRTLHERQGTFPPLYAIGGIEINDIKSLMAAGVHGVALSGAITRAPGLIQQIDNILDDYVTNRR